MSCRKEQKSKQLAELEADKILTRVKQYSTGNLKQAVETGLENLHSLLDVRINDAQREDEKSIADIVSRYQTHIENADKKVIELREKADNRKYAYYESCIKAMNNATSIFNYQKVYDQFTALGSYEDSSEYAEKCKTVIRELEEKDRRAAEAARRAKTRKIKIISIKVASLVVVTIATYFIISRIMIPNIKYDSAVKLMNEGKYAEAFSAFEAMNDFKDSSEKAKEIYAQHKIDIIRDASVGEMVIFGAYEQDNDTTNGKEKIEWIVLAKEDNRALVISKYALDCKPYSSYKSDLTWETCSLREWLNGEFYDSSFDAEEKEYIISSTVTADKNPAYSTSPGNSTTDKVFLLSITEVEKYFSSNSARACRGTDFCYVQGAYISGSNGNCCWWLRSPGHLSIDAACVRSVGSVHYYGDYYGVVNYAVRPALWINFES